MTEKPKTRADGVLELLTVKVDENMPEGYWLIGDVVKLPNGEVVKISVIKTESNELVSDGDKWFMVVHDDPRERDE